MQEQKTKIRSLVQKKFALKGLRGEHLGEVYPVGNDFTVGREKDNDLVVSEGFVSRHHASLHVGAGILTVTDNHSSNGTHINGVPVSGSAVANIGDHIKFDVIEFEVIEPQPEESIPPLPETSDVTQVRQVVVKENEPKIDESLSDVDELPPFIADDIKTVVAEPAPARPVDQDEKKTVIAPIPDMAKEAAQSQIKTVVGDSNQNTTVVAAPVKPPENNSTSNINDQKTVMAPAPIPEQNQPDVSPIKPASMHQEEVSPVELVGKTPPVVNRSFKLARRTITVGRSPFNDIVLKTSSVSSRHAEIECVAGAWWVRDLHSSNGTYVNDEPIEERQIFHNDSLVFGEVQLTFDPSGRVPVPPGAKSRNSDTDTTGRTATLMASVVAIVVLIVLALLVL